MSMANLVNSRKNKYHIIYKTTNIINNKIYIGAHSTDNVDDGYLGSGKLINESIKKYGVENFKKEILYFFKTPEEMFEKEKEIVTEEFINRSDVYNIVTGGFGGFNKGSKDLRHITNIDTGEVMAVNKSKLAEFLNNGWKMGGVEPSNKGKIYVHNEHERIAVSKEEIEKYLKNGWIKGYEKSPTVGKVWIYNKIINQYTLCDKIEINLYLEKGWIRKKWPPIKKGSIWINNNGLRKRINPELLSQYLDLGWTKGKN